MALKITIITATAHYDAMSGQLNQKQMLDLYNRKEGFTVKFDDTDGTHSTLTLSWKHVIELADHLLIFGPPLDGVWTYNAYFCDEGDEMYHWVGRCCSTSFMVFFATVRFLGRELE